MRTEHVKRSMDTSFAELCWPVMRDRIAGPDCRLQMIEARDMEPGSLRWAMDDLAGIDGIAWSGLGCRTLSIRVQPVDTPYASFTVRTKRSTGPTEYEKRCWAIGEGWSYPDVTIQCYVDRQKTKMLAAGMVRTLSLMAYIYKAQPGLLQTRRETDPDGTWAEWVPVYWDALQTAGIDVITW